MLILDVQIHGDRGLVDPAAAIIDTFVEDRLAGLEGLLSFQAFDSLACGFDRYFFLAVRGEGQERGRDIGNGLEAYGYFFGPQFLVLACNGSDSQL